MTRHRPEFHRPIIVVRVPPSGSTEILVADATERADLAARLGVPAIHALRARLRVEPWRMRGLKVEGEIVADLDRACVVTLDDFRARVTLPVLRYFLPPSDIPADAGEAEEADADPVRDGKADLGELVAETLVLDLDPYPRKPGARFEAAFDASEPGTSPFADLARLKSRRGGRAGEA